MYTDKNKIFSALAATKPKSFKTQFIKIKLKLTELNPKLKPPCLSLN
jgi:hypothetical protein